MPLLRHVSTANPQNCRFSLLPELCLLLMIISALNHNQIIPPPENANKMHLAGHLPLKRANSAPIPTIQQANRLQTESLPAGDLRIVLPNARESV